MQGQSLAQLHAQRLAQTHGQALAKMHGQRFAQAIGQRLAHKFRGIWNDKRTSAALSRAWLGWICRMLKNSIFLQPFYHFLVTPVCAEFDSESATCFHCLSIGNNLPRLLQKGVCTSI